MRSAIRLPLFLHTAHREPVGAVARAREQQTTTEVHVTGIRT